MIGFFVGWRARVALAIGSGIGARLQKDDECQSLLNEKGLPMKRILIVLSVLAMLGTAPLIAQTRSRTATSTTASKDTNSATSNRSTTPEMWLYQQYQRDYLDPKMAVRRNAEFARSQRQRRLAAMKWFGFSNQRPSAISDPYHGGTWSPTWSGSNNLYPYRWQAYGHPSIVVAPRAR